MRIRDRIGWYRERRMLDRMTPQDQIRHHFTMLGVPEIGRLTDEEIEAGVLRTAALMASTGISIDDPEASR